jgi:hypothetical protein
MLAHLEPVAGTGEVAAHQVWRGRNGRGALSGEGASVRGQDQTLFSTLMTRSVPSSRDRWIHTSEGPGPLGPIWPRRTSPVTVSR